LEDIQVKVKSLSVIQKVIQKKKKKQKIKKVATKKKQRPVKCEFFQSVERVMMEGVQEDTYFGPEISGCGRDDVKKKITDFLKNKEFVCSNQSSLVILGKFLIRTTEYTIWYRDKDSS